MGSNLSNFLIDQHHYTESIPVLLVAVLTNIHNSRLAFDDCKSLIDEILLALLCKSVKGLIHNTPRRVIIHVLIFIVRQVIGSGLCLTVYLNAF